MFIDVRFDSLQIHSCHYLIQLATIDEDRQLFGEAYEDVRVVEQLKCLESARLDHIAYCPYKFLNHFVAVVDLQYFVHFVEEC